jgi:hypothetical protein
LEAALTSILSLRERRQKICRGPLLFALREREKE